MDYVEVDQDDFIRGLRLLHSRSKESSDELKKMLDICISKQLNLNNETRKSKDYMNVFSAIQSLNHEFKNDKEKRTKSNEDDSEATDVEDNENADSGEFVRDLGFTCAVCKKVEITTNNQLVECQECRLLFHQECHKPLISKKDNDPRSVWYCSKCSKNIKKIGKTTVNKFAPNKSILSTSTVTSTMASSSFTVNCQSGLPKDTSTIRTYPSLSKSSDNDSKLNQQLYKRSQGKFSANKLPVGSSINRSNSTASMSSNLKGKISTSATNNSSSYGSSTNQMIQMDKRFPNLKKSKMSKFSN